METQAFFDNIQAQIQTRLLAAETDIDLAVAWFTDRSLFDTVCQKAKTGVNVRLMLFDEITASLDPELIGEVIKVLENPMINRVAFEGNDNLSDQRLKDEVNLRPREVLSVTAPKVGYDFCPDPYIFF